MITSLAASRSTLWSLVVVAVWQLTACASVVENRVEQALLDALPQVLGPAAQYDVQVTGASRQVRGLIELDRVHAVGKRVQRPGSPVLDQVEADLTGVQVDRERQALAALAGADLYVRILAADVAAFLETRATLKDVRVTFQESDVVMVSARPVIAGFSLPAAARLLLRGYVVPQDAQLRLNLTDLRMVGFPIGTIPTKIVERLINPIADLEALPVPTQVTSARIRGGALIVTARGSRFRGELAP